MGGFELKVQRDGVYHKSENITAFVRDMMSKYTTLDATNVNLGGYNAAIDDITFKATGCENHKTTLSQWKNVWSELSKMQKT